ncbi:hypothetical protein ACO1PK_00845 [Alishewanella sp. d11]|uniref:hypothetical protein n=1 Tax=Alishewanella sp. d11 TaxID=3414030 RepID=UPI003BF7BDA8
MSEEKQQYNDNKPTATQLDWELQQALIHLRNAMAMTDNHRAHLLNSAVCITKGVKES